MKNNLILKRFFTKKMINDLLTNGNNKVFDSVIKRYIKNPNGKQYNELISEIYVYMSKEYRNEYFYKNTMLNKLLFKKYNYKKTAALTELPIGKSKADFVMINGKGIVYEIKTQLDNLDRIESQIEDYYKAFSEVIVVTYSENIEKVVSTVPNSVGIMELTKRKALNTIREASTEKNSLQHKPIFNLLRKYEFEEIIIESGYELPCVNQFEYYKECFRTLKKINIEKLQNMMLEQLKKRVNIETVEFSLQFSHELRFLLYFNKRTKYLRTDLNRVLKRSYGG